MSYVNANYQLIIDGGFYFWIMGVDDIYICIFSHEKFEDERGDYCADSYIAASNCPFPARYKKFSQQFQKCIDEQAADSVAGGYNFAIRYIVKARKARRGSLIDQSMCDLINQCNSLKRLKAVRQEASIISAALPATTLQQAPRKSSKRL